MKNIIFIIIASIFSFGSLALASSQIWADEDLKVVTVLPINTLKVSLSKYGESDELFGELTYEWNYSYADAKLQLASAQSTYPEYQVRRVSIESLPQGLKFEIPALGFTEVGNPKRSIEGFYANSGKILNKQEYLKLKEALDKKQILVRIIGDMQTQVFKGQTVFQTNVSKDICNDLLGATNTMLEMIQNTALSLVKMVVKNPKLSAKFQANLIRRTQNSCFEMPSSQINSYDEMMKLKISPKRDFKESVVKEVVEVQSPVVLPITYNTEVASQP